MREWRPRACLATICLGLAGCGDSAPPKDSVPTDTLEIALSIGATEGDGPEVFGRVSGLAADSEGRILVADMQSHEIRVFDSVGEFRYAIGSEGAGPGELAGPCCLALDPSGRLWTKESGNARYSVFRPAEDGAEFVATHRLAHGDANFMAPLTFTRDGGFVDVGRRPTQSGQALLSRTYRSPAGDEVASEPITSTELDALGRYAVEIRGGPQMAIAYFYQPFGEEHLLAHGPDGLWADGISSEYRVTLRSAEGELTIDGAETEGPFLSQRERVIAQERLASIAENAGTTVAGLPFSIPDRKPVLRGMFFDNHGNLWVELSTEEGSLRTADVWNQSGVHLRTVFWPTDVELRFPSWIGEEGTFGIRRDELGVEYVVRLD